jgi:lactoylglutathione lyase
MSAISDAFSGELFAVTLFVESLDASEEFYGSKLGLQKVFSDEASLVYRAGSTMINLLLAVEAIELISPAQVAGVNSGVRAMYTLAVADVDAVASALTGQGVQLLNGPIDRPWGVRTASFCDPSGHVWEIADHK